MMPLEKTAIPYDPEKKTFFSGSDVAHDISVERTAQVAGTDWPSPVFMELPAPVVSIANNDDGWYIERFSNWTELSAFIEKLEAAGTEAWGPRPGR
jgi:hypothetical protein